MSLLASPLECGSSFVIRYSEIKSLISTKVHTHTLGHVDICYAAREFIFQWSRCIFKTYSLFLSDQNSNEIWIYVAKVVTMNMQKLCFPFILMMFIIMEIISNKSCRS